MTPQAFMHLPELEGRITPPEASGLRLTDEVLAAWDAQARAQGLPDDWRLPDADVERSRQAVLADIGGEDLWVFGYGSLMWNPGIHFQEVRRASLDGFARRFALATTIGRCTTDCPGLSLEDTAAIIASACGSVGSNRAYLDQLNEQLDLLGIEDDHVRALSAAVECRYKLFGV